MIRAGHRSERIGECRQSRTPPGGGEAREGRARGFFRESTGDHFGTDMAEVLNRGWDAPGGEPIFYSWVLTIMPLGSVHSQSSRGRSGNPRSVLDLLTWGSGRRRECSSATDTVGRGPGVLLSAHRTESFRPTRRRARLGGRWGNRPVSHAASHQLLQVTVYRR